MKANSYGGISLTSNLSKVFVHILKGRLTEWTDDNKLISEEQAGFRKRYSTVDNIFILFGLIPRQLQKRKKIVHCFCIFSEGL